MKLSNLFKNSKKKTVLIVQCRLSSTRLPRKALLSLGGRTIIEWVLASMRLVPVDEYYLATDYDSAPELEPIAKKCGWKFFAGSKEDVLDRFCKVIELSKADVVVRATADNPFLFYEAAEALVDEYSKRCGTEKIDYITWTGLPHGSGVEMFDAHSLLQASTQTELPYDRENVGPALYNHQDKFTACFLKAPNRWYFPELRTTIDTPADYRRSLALVRALSGKATVEKPYTTEQIIKGMWDPAVKNPVLLIPSVVKGRGTGHLRRCLDIALKCGADIYVPVDASLEQSASLVADARQKGLEDWQIVRNLSLVAQYSLIITDLFRADDSIIKQIPSSVAIASFDEGTGDTQFADYLLDIIPSVGVSRNPNRTETGFIALPKKHRDPGNPIVAIHTAVVTLGGEDPAGLSIPAARALASCNVYVTLIESNAEEIQKDIPEQYSKYIKCIQPVEGLRDRLNEYDLVVTHYGFTAFEAGNAGCAVILLGTTDLHQQLAEKYGFASIPSDSISDTVMRRLISNPQQLLHNVKNKNCPELSQFVMQLSQGKHFMCPICQKFPQKKDAIVARTPDRTFRRCSHCGIIYMSWTLNSQTTKYDHAYFYEDYQKQYGKTYLEDFASIKAQCVRRTSVIDFMYRRRHSTVTPTVFDIGCAMGPFLDAANDSGWQVFGMDISPDAVQYVQQTLHFPAVCAPFPEFDASAEFGINQFDAVTMWYVIEHFQNLDAVLSAVSRLVKKGGLFAFSTPSASGVSAKYHYDDFFKNSPADHYSIWETKRAKTILAKYGFKIIKIISTGIHPERVPLVQKKSWKEKSFGFAAVAAASRFLQMGDTFEVYCRKVKDLQKEKI